MDAKKALDIVSALADGCDPATGEVMGGDHVLQQPDVVRALAAAAAALGRQASTREREAGKPARAGQPWTPDEDERLLSAFDRETTIEKLAAKHARTRGAVESRLVKLGRLDPVSRRSRSRRAEPGRAETARYAFAKTAPAPNIAGADDWGEQR